MKILTEPGQLVVELRGWEQFWGLKERVTIPRATITAINWESCFDDWRNIELRLPGTSVPGALIAGSFWSPQGWDFLYVRKPHGWFRPKAPEVMIIETRVERYRRVIVSAKKADVERLLSWWKQGS